ncbi:MAG: hypothetical protein WBM13_01095 [Bacteroidia bacterium]
MKKRNSIILIAILSIASQYNAIAQCKSIVKEGIQKLSPYTHNGQVNNVTLKEGKTAKLHLSFYKGLNYKLQISAEESLGKINFRVLDENQKEVYNSSTAEKPVDFWNFYSNSSQELIIELTSSAPKKGCAAVIVGMQVPKKSNPIRNL